MISKLLQSPLLSLPVFPVSAGTDTISLTPLPFPFLSMFDIFLIFQWKQTLEINDDANNMKIAFFEKAWRELWCDCETERNRVSFEMTTTNKNQSYFLTEQKSLGYNASHSTVSSNMVF